MKNTTEIISGLNDLLTKNYDAESGYKTALEQTDIATLKIFFGDRANQRYRFGKEIKAAIIALGGTPDKGTSLLGNMHRAWIDFKTALSFDSEEAILEECERGEETSLNAYNEFLQTYAIPVSLHETIANQRDLIKNALMKLEVYEERFD